MQLMRFAIDVTLRDKFDLPDLIMFGSLGGSHNREKPPFDVPNRILKLLAEVRRAGIWMLGFHQIIDQAKEIRTVA